MIVHRSRTVKHAILLREDDILALHAICKEHYKKAAVSAECADGSSFNTDDPQEILNWSNPTERKFIRMTFSGSAENSFDDYVSVMIATGGGLLLSTITAFINVKADSDKRAVLVTHPVEECLGHTKPPYNFFATAPLIAWILLVMLCVFAISSMIFGNKPLEVNVPLMVGAVVLGSVGGPFIEKLKNYIFPPVFFMVGRQKEVYNLLVYWRTGVIAALILGIIASVIAAVIMR